MTDRPVRGVVLPAVVLALAWGCQQREGKESWLVVASKNGARLT